MSAPIHTGITEEENRAIVAAASKPEGYVYRQLRNAVRDAIRVYGSAGAKNITLEIFRDIERGR